MTSIARNSFTIELNDLFGMDSAGNGSFTFKPDTLLIPTDTLSTIKFAPRTLRELVDMVGKNNITIQYFVRASGYVSGHDCSATYTIYTYGDFGGKIAGPKPMWSAGKPPVNSGWLPFVTTSEPLNRLYTNQDCKGSGCKCFFKIKGGWRNTKISLRVVVTVDLINYCTLPGTNNIQGDMCYEYMSNYLSTNQPSQSISDYLQNFCLRTFPEGGLENLLRLPENNKLGNICGCNMPGRFYDELVESINGANPNINLTQVAPACVFPRCVKATFKNNQLRNCPPVRCLNIVNLNGNKIIGNVIVEQSNECSDISVDNTPPATNPPGSTPPGSKPPPPNGGSKPPPAAGSFWTRNRWLIIGSIILLIIIIIIVFFVIRRNKNTTLETNIDTYGAYDTLDDFNNGDY